MHNKRMLLAVSAAVLGLAAMADTTLTVAKTGNDAAAAADPSLPFLTVGAANAKASEIVASNPGERVTISVGAGDYQLTGSLAPAAGVSVIGAGPAVTSLIGNPGGTALGQPLVTLASATSTVSGLMISNNTSSVTGVGIRITAGTATNCCVKYCQTSGNSVHAGGIYVKTGGFVFDCEIANCKAMNLYSRGNALYIDGGYVSGCNIHDCNGGYDSGTPGNGSAIVYLKSGTFEKSRVHHNDKGGISGVAQDGGTMRNCLIYANTARYSAAGLYKIGGSTYHCTLFGNVLSGDDRGLSGLNQSGGVSANNIIYGNGLAGNTVGSCYVTGGTFNTNVVDLAALLGVGNIESDPRFVDAANNDFHLADASSAAAGAGAPITTVLDDLDGMARSVIAPSVGAYELAAPSTTLVAAIQSFQSRYPQGAAVTLHGRALGQNAAGASFAWYVDGAVDVASTDRDATFEGLAPGRHSFKLDVTNGNETATAERADLVAICPLTNYVNTSGSGVFPYATPGTATSSLSEAFKAVWKAATITTRVEIAAGGYTLDKTITISTPVEIVGAGAGSTFFNALPTSPRAFYLQSAGAVLDGVAVTNTRAIASGCGAMMSKGVIRHCRFAYCASTVNYCYGAGVNMSGGRLESTEIDHCTANNTYSCANALYLSGGVATGCDFHHCDGGYSHNNPVYGSAIVQILGTGVLEKTRVHDNTRGSIGGIYQTGGTVANCLVYGNTANNHSAGLYKTAGSTYYCTVYGNVVIGDTTGCSGVNQSGGVTVDNIFYGNGPAGGTLGSCYVTGGTFNTNVIDVAIIYGIFNNASDPQFVDAGNADFHLSTRASPAFEKADPVALFADDFDGMPRAEKPSIGAFEYDASGEVFGADITALQTDYLVGTPVPLSGVVLGAEAGEVSFAWYLDGSASAASTEQNPTFHNLALGRHSVKLVVTRGSETAEADKPDLIAIRPLTVYVNKTGSGVYPYATPETATNAPFEAYRAVWTGESVTSRLEIAAGTYPLDGCISVFTPFEIVGAGRDETVLDGGGVAVGPKAFSLESDLACLHGLTVSNVTSSGTGCGATLVKGVIRGCRFTYCTTDGYSMVGGSGVYMTGGLLDDVVIDHGGARGLYSYGSLNMSGGIATNCLIFANVGGSSGQYNRGHGAVVDGAGALLTHSVIRGNGTLGMTCQAAGVYLKNGTLRNCLVADNLSKDYNAGVYLGDGSTAPRLESCTIAGNRTVTDANGNAALHQASGRVLNCILYGNGPEGATGSGCYVAGGVFTTNCLAAPLDGYPLNLVENPRFRNPAEGDYHLMQLSPVIDQGDNQPWMVGAGDLDGLPRLHLGGRVDLGCYESPRALGTKVIVR